ncbi:hypothetical protein GQ457_17G023140 [Hibiscus cannabinus]
MYCSSGVFTLASAFRVLVDVAWDPTSSLWSNIWSLTVPQRIRAFLWLVVLVVVFPRQFSTFYVTGRQFDVFDNPLFLLITMILSSRYLYEIGAPLSGDVSWQPPQQGWFCLNIDAAVKAVTNMGSIEGIIRGSSGEWIIGYTKQIGHVSPLQAELWSILVGLEVTWSMCVEQL